MTQEKFYAVTPEIRTSFMDVFSPKVWEGETEGEYQCTLLFNKQADVATVQKAVSDALKDEFGDNVPKGIEMPWKKGDNVPKGIEMPWKKGEEVPDKEGNVRDGYAGKIVVKTKSKFKPIILWPDTTQMTDLDSDEFQSGDYARVKVEAKVWTFAGKKGVSCYLKVIQKTRTGERFGGDVDVSDFSPVAEAEEAGGLF